PAPHRRHRLRAGIPAWRRIGAADGARDHHLLRLRLPDRPQGLRRRDRRWARQLSLDRGRRCGCRRAGKLRLVLEQLAQGKDRVRRPYPRAAVALVDDPAPGRGTGGDRVSGLSLEKAVLGLAVVGLAAAPLLVAPFTVTLLNYVGIGALVALGLV